MRPLCRSCHAVRRHERVLVVMADVGAHYLLQVAPAEYPEPIEAFAAQATWTELSRTVPASTSPVPPCWRPRLARRRRYSWTRRPPLGRTDKQGRYERQPQVEHGARGVVVSPTSSASLRGRNAREAARRPPLVTRVETARAESRRTSPRSAGSGGRTSSLPPPRHR